MACSVGNDGVLMASTRRGPQDEWVAEITGPNSRGHADLHAALLGGNVYNCGYGRLSTERVSAGKSWNSTATSMGVCWVLKRDCDLVDGLDLVLDLKAPGDRVRILQAVVTIGGQRYDRVEGLDFGRVVDTTCEFLGDARRTTLFAEDRKCIVPLPLAPFAGRSFALLYATEHHEVSVEVDLDWPELGGNKEELKRRATLMGRRYHVPALRRQHEPERMIEWLVYQHQTHPVEVIRPGVNRIRLMMTHPCQALVLLGPELRTADIQRVRVVLSAYDGVDDRYTDATLVDADIPELAYAHKAFTGRDMGADRVIVNFSLDPVGRPTLCAVNFSRIDRAYLEVDYCGASEIQVNIVAYNQQGARCACGMQALIYSK